MLARGVGALWLADWWNIKVPIASLILMGVITVAFAALGAVLRLGSAARRQKRGPFAWSVAGFSALAVLLSVSYVIAVLTVYIRSINDVLNVLYRERNLEPAEDNPGRSWYVDYDMRDYTARGVLISLGVLTTANCLAALSWTALRVIGQNIGQDGWRTRRDEAARQCFRTYFGELGKLCFRQRISPNQEERSSTDLSEAVRPVSNGTPNSCVVSDTALQRTTLVESSVSNCGPAVRDRKLNTEIEKDSFADRGADLAQVVSHSTVEMRRSHERFIGLEEHLGEAYDDQPGRIGLNGQTGAEGEDRRGNICASGGISPWSTLESDAEPRDSRTLSRGGRDMKGSMSGELEMSFDRSEKSAHHRMRRNRRCVIAFLFVSSTSLLLLAAFAFHTLPKAQYLTPKFARELSLEAMIRNSSIFNRYFKTIPLQNLGEIACFGNDGIGNLRRQRNLYAEFRNETLSAFREGNFTGNWTLEEVGLPSSKCEVPGLPGGPATDAQMVQCANLSGTTGSRLAQCLCGTDRVSGQPVIPLRDILRAGQSRYSDFGTTRRSAFTVTGAGGAAVAVLVWTLFLWTVTVYELGDGGAASLLWTASLFIAVPIGAATFGVYQNLCGGPICNMFSIVPGPIWRLPTAYLMAGPGPVAELAVNASAICMLVLLLVLASIAVTNPRESVMGIDRISERIRM